MDKYFANKKILVTVKYCISRQRDFMKYIAKVIFCSLLVSNITYANMGAADTDPPPMTTTTESPSQQIEQFNAQIQNQMKVLQTEQQQQITTLNSQLQAQLKQLQTDLQNQIKTVNTQTQAQMKQMQETLHEQINQVQQQIKH